MATVIRIIMLCWFPLLLVSLILIRYHYSCDIIVACFVAVLVATNTHLLQWWVRMIYRPYYVTQQHNASSTHLSSPHAA
jgi:hypothetical protein